MCLIVFGIYVQDIRVFFRDLSTNTLKEEVVEQLHENIPILLCNLEKIFPTEFLTSWSI